MSNKYDFELFLKMDDEMLLWLGCMLCSLIYICVCAETMGSEGEGDARADEEAEEWSINIGI